MNDSQRHDVEQQKPGTKRCVLYDTICLKVKIRFKKPVYVKEIRIVIILGRGRAGEYRMERVLIVMEHEGAF